MVSLSILICTSLTGSEAEHLPMLKGHLCSNLCWKGLMCSLENGWGMEDWNLGDKKVYKGDAQHVLLCWPSVLEGAGGSANSFSCHGSSCTPSSSWFVSPPGSTRFSAVPAAPATLLLILCSRVRGLWFLWSSSSDSSSTST